MAWRLVDEILDGCPRITYIEFRVLVALARDARDETRQAMPGHELLALRGNCSIRNVRRALAGLAARGLIKQTAGSAPGRRAVYEILPMAAATPDNKVAGERRTEPHQRRTETARTADNKVATPRFKPLVHSPSSGARTAQTIIAAFIDWDRDQGGQLTRRTINQLARHIGDLLAEGIEDKHIRQGLADWRARNQHPSTLHSFVDAAMNGHHPKSRRQAETDDMFGRAMERAARRLSTGDRAIAEAEALKAQLRELP